MAFELQAAECLALTLTSVLLPSFSEGIITYYWAVFSVPNYKWSALDKAMANIQESIQAGPPKLRNSELRIESVVAFREFGPVSFLPFSLPVILDCQSG